MRRLGCQGVTERLPWFVGGDLDAGQQREVRRHLQACASCRQQASSLLQAHRALLSVRGQTDWRGLPPPFALMQQQVMDAVATAGVASHEPASRRGFVAAAAALLFGLGFWFGAADTARTGLLGRDALPFPAAAAASGPGLSPLGNERRAAWRSAKPEPGSPAPAGSPSPAGATPSRSGLRGRLLLRTLEDEWPLPASAWAPAGAEPGQRDR
jgi:hypothetical protein